MWSNKILYTILPLVNCRRVSLAKQRHFYTCFWFSRVSEVKRKLFLPQNFHFVESVLLSSMWVSQTNRYWNCAAQTVKWQLFFATCSSQRYFIANCSLLYVLLQLGIASCLVTCLPLCFCNCYPINDDENFPSFDYILTKRSVFAKVSTNLEGGGMFAIAFCLIILRYKQGSCVQSVVWL